MRKSILALSLIVSIGIGTTGDVFAAGTPGFTPGGPPSQTTGTSPTNPPASSSRTTSTGVSGAAVVQFAERFLGYPYTTVGNSPSTGFSCIGFVSYVYQSLGIGVPDGLSGAYAFAPQIAFSNLQPGDVLFFQNTIWPGLSHTAIYIGGGKMIHAEWYNRGVVISSFTNDPIDGNYWTSHYLGANRPWAGTTTASAAVTSPVVQPTTTPKPAAAPNSLSVPARQQAPSGPVTTVRVSSLNVRSRPSIRAGVETVVTRGTKLVILSRRYRWDRVALSSGLAGWVIRRGVRDGSAPAGRVSTRSRIVRSKVHLRRSNIRIRAANRTVRRAIHTLGRESVRVNGLRVHSAPSLSADVVTTVSRGQHVSVIRRTNRWLRIQLSNGYTGWVSRQFMQSPSAWSTPVRKLRATTVSAVRGTHSVRVAVNVHRNPSLSATVVSIVVPGGRYHLLGMTGFWVHVRLANNTVGWISRSVLGGISTRTVSQSVKQSITTRHTASLSSSTVTASIRLHADPSLSSPATGLVAARTHVTVLGSSAGWTKIRLPNRRTGYVVGIYVKN